MEENIINSDHGDGTVGDPLYGEAYKVVMASGYASPALLQRLLQIDYESAATLMNLLEVNGVIGPEDGAKPRPVIIHRDLHMLQTMNQTKMILCFISKLARWSY